MTTDRLTVLESLVQDFGVFELNLPRQIGHVNRQTLLVGLHEGAFRYEMRLYLGGQNPIVYALTRVQMESLLAKRPNCLVLNPTAKGGEKES